MIAPVSDVKLGLYYRVPEPLNLLVAIVLIILGLLLAIWSGFAQLKIGRGTPVPAIPTQRLVAIGSYALCRNPMLLESMVYYLGISLWINSLSALMMTVLFLMGSVVYIKSIEEKKLEAKFGEE